MDDLGLAGVEQLFEGAGNTKVSFSGDSPQSREWLVEESGTQCKLWFDSKSLLTKKRKILTSE